ncbi:MAG: hypothetical protein ACRC1F_03225 [Metamycoplasmataceae bacterium]
MLDWFKDFILGLGELILAIPGMILDLLSLITNIVVMLFNLIIMLVCGIVNLVVSILPDSPFDIEIIDSLVFPILEPLQYLAWLFPIGLMLKTLVAWVSCMLIWFGGQIILRYFKIIN